jgi:hypothetical protein
MVESEGTMRAADRVLPYLSRLRPRGDHRWTALCPAHEDKTPSLTIREAADRILIRCWAGCTAEEITAAFGLTTAALFDTASERRRNPVADHRRLAAEGLEMWRQKERQRCAEDLRMRDTIIGEIEHAVQDGLLTEDEAIASLSYEYDGYSELEYRFERLLTGTVIDALEVYRDG